MLDRETELCLGFELTTNLEIAKTMNLEAVHYLHLRPKGRGGVNQCLFALKRL